ncbi:hypothetical protein OAM01_00020 [bacterium]|nr:hypothetical protein [bacterium]
MKPSLATCRYPFRSPEVMAIYENLTSDEASRFKQYSWIAGGLFGALVPTLLFPLLYYFIRHNQEEPWVFLVVFAGAIPLGLIIGLVGGAPIRSKAKKMLCDSAYAKEQGYTPKNLRLYSFKKRNITVR